MPKPNRIEQIEKELRRNPMVLARMIATAEKRGVRFRYALGMLMVESHNAPFLSEASRRVLNDIWMELSIDLRREAELRLRQSDDPPQPV